MAGEQKVGRAVLELTIEDTQYKHVLESIKSDAKKTADGVRGISEAVDVEILKKLGEIGVEAFKKITEGIIELGERGAKVSDVATSFEALTQKAGSTSEVMLGALREGVVGTINDFDLMTLGNRALGSELVKSADDMRTMAEGARALAKATGGETKDAFETLDKVIATGKANKLKALGLFVETKGAIEDYARAHHKAVDDLTEHEQAAARAGAVIAALKQRMKEIPPDARDFGENIEHAKAALENFRDEVAKGVSESPVFKAMFSTIGKAVSEAVGPDQSALVKFFVSLIEKFAIGLTTVAQISVEVARVSVLSWKMMEIGFNALAGMVVNGVSDMLNGFSKLASAAAIVNPLFGATKKVADGAKEAAQSMKELAGGFAAQAKEGVKSADSTDKAFDKVRGVVDKVKNAMVAAQGNIQEHAKKTEKVLTETTAAQKHLTDKQIEEQRKIKETLEKLNAELVAGTKLGLAKRLAEIEVNRVKELASVAALKGGTVAQMEDMKRLVNQKYDQMASKAKASGDEIANRERRLRNEIAQLTRVGLDQKIAALDNAEAEEIQNLAELKENYRSQYDTMAALVHEKYGIMRAAALGNFTSVKQAAFEAGFRTRTEMKTTADQALKLYQDMLTSGLYTTEQLRVAHENAEKAKQVASQKGVEFQKLGFQNVAAAASGILTSLFGKSKAAGIAAATLDTAAAIVRTFKEFGWPAGLVPAAAMAAAGAKQISQIRSTSPSGFKTGTPGLDFVDFGTESREALHGKEAVIPKGGGHQLAGEIAASLKSKSMAGDPVVALLTRAVSALERQPETMKRAMRHGLLFTGK